MFNTKVQAKNNLYKYYSSTNKCFFVKFVKSVKCVFVKSIQSITTMKLKI